jgi:anti-sigma regulatory factor (Ser/Thr protein kinase)
MFVDTIAATTADISLLRHRFRAWLQGIGVSDERSADILVAVNEAVTNAVVHGSRLDPTNTVQLEACAPSDAIVVSVTDAGQWLPGVERDPTVGGRGFKIMERLSDAVSIEATPLGTNVSLRWDRRSPS